MSYTLQGIIGRTKELRPIYGVDPVALNLGFSLLPFTKTLRDQAAIPFLPFTDEKPSELPQTLEALGLQLSNDGNVAYVEAQFWAGVGTQASIVWVKARKVQPLSVNGGAINTALQRLGVVVRDVLDEFEAIGLDRFRYRGDE